MRRRDFIACIGTALAWPVHARAQQAEQARRIGVLLPYADNDLEAKSHLSALAQELKRLGWSQDHNLRIDARFAAGIADQYPVLAKELAALQPDVMLSEFDARRRCAEATEPLDSNRVYRGLRPAWLGPCRELGAAGG